MTQRQTATFTFLGTLPEASFIEFAQHRAGRLSLGLRVVAQNSTTATLCVSGPVDLVEAFEMAMSLGPADCLVREVIRTATPCNRSEKP
ncbi:hypothetical protein KM176_14990 [Pseudooceanicola sp. CBS1P-1]|uniref:Acylphosphatase-like domain-containing protein n=1 Tax=Pseudooceanicola albus TaxID=2692189 RepID=A0A6L7G779_9RHOB|nr:MULTISPECIES: hypothetical protein [Pseudooceanicola]MBT9385175.1 hypothetical protein [Pseudooceanicola endophyticus]MXN18533.1 hypothetical protein [Pseudooceanicola albus]